MLNTTRDNSISATHWETLGVSPSATDAEIKAAYRTLARMHHPDNGSSPDDVKFKAVAGAYEVLRDSDKRARYQQKLTTTTFSTSPDLLNSSLLRDNPDFIRAFVNDIIHRGGNGCYRISVSLLAQKEAACNTEHLSDINRDPIDFENLRGRPAVRFTDIAGRLAKEASVRLIPSSGVNEREAAVMISCLGRLGAKVMQHASKSCPGEIYFRVTSETDESVIAAIESKYHSLTNDNDSCPFPIRTLLMIAGPIPKELVDEHFSDFLLHNLLTGARWMQHYEPISSGKTCPALILSESAAPSGFGDLGDTATAKFYENALRCLTKKLELGTALSVRKVIGKDGGRKRLALLTHPRLIDFLEKAGIRFVNS
jgi:hypothetical protein